MLDPENIESVFDQLAQAVAEDDAERFSSIMATPGDAFQLELFKRNSNKMRGAGARLRYRDAVRTGDSAKVYFTVVGASDEVLAEGELRMAHHADGWLIAEL